MPLKPAHLDVSVGLGIEAAAGHDLHVDVALDGRHFRGLSGFSGGGKRNNKRSRRLIIPLHRGDSVEFAGISSPGDDHEVDFDSDSR